VTASTVSIVTDTRIHLDRRNPRTTWEGFGFCAESAEKISRRSRVMRTAPHGAVTQRTVEAPSGSALHGRSCTPACTFGGQGHLTFRSEADRRSLPPHGWASPPLSCVTLPRAHWSGPDREQGMGERPSSANQCLMALGVSLLQLAAKVRPGLRDLASSEHPPELGRIEAVAPSERLGVDHSQIGVQARDRIRACSKPRELGMVPVPKGPAAQHRARQQPLAPDGDWAAGVEIRGMDGPEPHGRPASATRIIARSVNDRDRSEQNHPRDRQDQRSGCSNRVSSRQSRHRHS